MRRVCLLLALPLVMVYDVLLVVSLLGVLVAAEEGEWPLTGKVVKALIA